MRRLSALALVLLLPACRVGPAPDVGPLGPALVLDVRNASDRELIIGYDFEAGASSGGGEGLVGPCERQAIMFGEIGGSYTVTVDGSSVVESTVPAGAPVDATMVVTVLVGPDGEVEVPPPAFVRAPNLDPATIPGCG